MPDQCSRSTNERQVQATSLRYRFVIHDRDCIYSNGLDASLKSLGLTVLKTPYKSPQANAFCERLIGTVCRECLDFTIPLNENHIRQTLKSWTTHYNSARPHSSLGPGIPNPSSPAAEVQAQRHCIPKNRRIMVTSILGGLHHEYRLVAERQVDLIAGNSTDGLIDALGLVVLQDDKHYFPPYDAVPLVRNAVVAKHPEVREALRELGGKITEDQMRRMNYAVDGEHKEVKDVVREFLNR